MSDKSDMAERFRARWPELFTEVECGFWAPEGWELLLIELCEQIAPLIGPDFRVAQVKEKFGGLRFYCSGSNAEVDDLIWAAEAASVETCQGCGWPGTRRGKGWIQTLCKECAEEKPETD